MPNFITNITQIRFDKSAMRILWTEAILFSALFGLIFRSWPIAILLFSVLFAFLHSQNRAVYAVFILTFLWGFIVVGIAFELGWVWAVTLRVVVFYKGLKLHLHDLKGLLNERDFGFLAWKKKGYLQRYNLN